MGRYIDVDKLKDNILNKGSIMIDEGVSELESMHEVLVYLLEKVEAEVIRQIDETPTAYDVEAVVKQIEELVECDENGCGKTFYLGQGCSACMFGKIIEIVRKGGMDNE